MPKAWNSIFKPEILLLPLPDYHKVMELLFSNNFFSVEFSPDLHVLRYPLSKKVNFENPCVRTYAGVCVCECESEGIYRASCLQN